MDELVQANCTKTRMFAHIAASIIVPELSNLYLKWMLRDNHTSHKTVLKALEIFAAYLEESVSHALLSLEPELQDPCLPSKSAA